MLRIGVVGCGAVSLRGLLPHLTMEDVRDRVKVTAVCDRDGVRAQWAAGEFGVPHWFTSAGELYHSGQVDAVTIASPIALHYEQGKAALEAGLDVHVNKPLAMNVAEAEELLQLARDRGAVMVASPGQGLLAENKAIRELLEGGTVGKLAWAICGGSFGTYHQDEPERRDVPGEEPLRGEWYYKKPGGGPVYDMTVYALHNIVSVLGSVKSVMAMSGVLLPEREVGGKLLPCDADDNTLALLDFGGNRYAYCYGAAVGTIGHGLMPTYFTERASIEGYYIDGQPINKPAAALAGEAGISYKGNERWAGYWLLPHATPPHRQLQELHVFEDIMQLVDARAEGREPAIPATQAVHVVEIIEAMYRSAQDGVRVHLRTSA